MDFSSFKKAFNNLESVSSKTGSAGYHSIRVSGDDLLLTGINTGSNEVVSLTELYDVYQHLDFINTTILSDYITGRVYSPSYAVLVAAGFYDIRGNRINTPQINLSKESKSVVIDSEVSSAPVAAILQPRKKENDEARFFRVLSSIAGADYIQSKGIEKPVDTDLILLPCDFRSLTFESRIQSLLNDIVKALDGNFDFGKTSLAHLIDGLIIDHPEIGTRIVEFDEEQHFTPPRKISLQFLQQHLGSLYIPEFIKICDDLAYINSQVFKKHRISSGIIAIPSSISDFRAWLDKNAKSSGYVEAKNGFDYHGGRISQRAYYDSLRDVAHLAKENDHLSPPLRFAKKSFENEFHRSFKNITDEELAASTQSMLWKFYDIKLINANHSFNN